jgi:hypothetical protein
MERCNALRVRANPAGGYLCRYSASLDAPEFVCTIPDPGAKQKLSCDYEASLLCKVHRPQGGNVVKEDIRLECQSM